MHIYSVYNFYNFENATTIYEIRLYPIYCLWKITLKNGIKAQGKIDLCTVITSFIVTENIWLYSVSGSYPDQNTRGGGEKIFL